MNPQLLGAAANPALPADLVERLISLADPEIAEELACRPDLSRAQALVLGDRVPECAPLLARLGHLAAADIDPVARPDAALALLEEGRGGPEFARVLVRSAMVEHRARLAECPGLPGDVVDVLTSDADERVVAELALWATAEVTARLAEHPHTMVRRAVACNEATSPAILAALVTGEGFPPLEECERCAEAHYDAGAVRYAALLNPSTPVEAVVPQVNHDEVWPGWGLTARTDLPSETYELLAGHPVPGIRDAVAKNPAISDGLLRRLAEDEVDFVRRSVARNPRIPLDLLERLTTTTRIGSGLLPRIAAATEAETDHLARWRNPVLRMFVAERRDLPPAVRDALAADPDAKVIKSVAPHPGLDESQLRSMARRHGARVYAKVAANQAAPSSLLEELANKAAPVRKALREIARHPNATDPALRICLTDVQARVLAAGHPALAPSALADLLDHPDERVAEAAAANPALPQSLLREVVRAAQLS
ncbi:hypothetical protein G6045_14920 [Streptomyces sp. YC504]|uniref:Leucine rich repeat variant n=1 Tax=Streptomyces mesophilus TaxID=1775132 RepID=A0A6G4XHB1_9ACTN|nr:hypothetical protein [Streptomyces mesophilus]NGO76946.1 hypothetical protein [Streptomyces mesophilus]